MRWTEKEGLLPNINSDLKKVNHEQRIIEKDLERIRKGAHNQYPGKIHTLSPDKKFHHPNFGHFSASKNHHADGPKQNTHHEKDATRSKSGDASMDAMALVQYLQNFNKNYAETEEKGPDKHVKGSGPRQPNQLNVTKHLISDEYQPIEHNQINSSQSENLIESKERNRSASAAEDGCKYENGEGNDVRSNRHLSTGYLIQTTNSVTKSHENISMSSKANGNLDNKDGKNEGKMNRRASLPNTNSAPDYVPSPNTQKDSDKVSQAGDTKNAVHLQTAEEVLKLALNDPENYNPDGSIKTAYMQPSFEKRWEEAKKARYVRTKDPLERDRQLTAKEIFDKN